MPDPMAMSDRPLLPLLATAAFYIVHLAVAMRAVLRPHREPASRIAWVVVIMAVPVVGIVAYLLLGETSIGRRRTERRRRIDGQLPSPATVCDAVVGVGEPAIPERYLPLFRVATSVNGFRPVGGNSAELMANSNAMIAALVADIDDARDHVHLLFYIWLPDHSGLAIVGALQRAAARGVVCRAMVDALASRMLVGSGHWSGMRAAGVRIATALPVGNPLLRPFRGRIDLRNHRKIVVIDNRITYCGSQNCADPEFRVKPRFAPWVDAVVRFEGPVARQNQRLFAADWMAQVDEDLTDLLLQPASAADAGIAAQAIGTGPTVRSSAMPGVFETLVYAARRELVITTPYFVPGEAMHSALCNCARRGVETSLVFPARNDSRFVGAASRSYYSALLAAGVRIHEFTAGLLHAKTLTLDGEITLIGSANMDRRSFELNYENNILVHDPTLTVAVRGRQSEYQACSRLVTGEDVARWSLPRQLWNNVAAMLGPVL